MKEARPVNSIRYGSAMKPFLPEIVMDTEKQNSRLNKSVAEAANWRWSHILL